MREVFRNEYYLVEFSSELRLIRLTRSAVPQSVQILGPQVSELLDVMSRLRPANVLVDMRQAPGNNDPAFEKEAMAAQRQLLRGFGRVAILFQSAVGRLHFQRMSRELGESLHLFADEDEALRFLRALPLPPPAS